MLVGAWLLWLGQVGWAADGMPPSFDDDLWAELDRMPPRWSSELAFSVGFGEVSGWQTQVPPWLVFGFRSGWGNHFGADRQQRLGGSVGVFMEGPFPEYAAIALDPQATWDGVFDGTWLGVAVGPSGILYTKSTITGSEFAAGWGATLAGRVGWSEPFSRAKRRTFIGLEPKLRYAEGEVGWGAAVIVGSTHGH